MNILKRLISMGLILVLAACLFACDSGKLPGTDAVDPETGETIVKIVFDGQNYSCSREGAITVVRSSLVIGSGGTYELSGTLDDGQVRISAPKNEKVTLILNGVTLSCSHSAPLYIESADKCDIRLAAGTVNTLNDSANYVYETPEVTKPNACLYSSEDLDIEGEGELIVNAKYNNGIGTKNDLEIKGGKITVTAVKNALKGNDSVTVTAGEISLSGCTDGIKTDSLDVGKGFIRIEGGTIFIDSIDDGLQASQALDVVGGTVTLSVADKPYTCDGTTNVVESCIVLK